MNEDTKLSEEDLDNLTKVFSMLIKWDMEQNPHLYKKKNPTEINKEYADKQVDNSRL